MSARATAVLYRDKGLSPIEALRRAVWMAR